MNLYTVFADWARRHGVESAVLSFSESLPEGLYFFNPFTSTIVEMDTRVQRVDAETDTYTRDVRQAGIKYTLNYRLQQNAAHLMYRDIGRVACQGFLDLVQGKRPHGVINPEVFEKPNFQTKWQRLRAV